MTTKIERQQAEEFREVHRSAKAGQPVVEPTPDEARNGWTAETLTAYLAEQTTSQTLRIDAGSLHRRLARRPDRANSKYRPHRWRG